VPPLAVQNIESNKVVVRIIEVQKYRNVLSAEGSHGFSAAS
jgi:hypothetical protein